MKSILLILLFLTSLPSHSQAFDSTYGKPILVLYETDPWLMVVGSDVPTLALYENGQVIYKEVENRELKLYKKDVPKSQIKSFVKELHVTDSLFRLPKYIESSYSTDQPNNYLILNFDTIKTISVYGSISRDKEARKKTPKPFLDVYESIKSYRSDEAEEWLPEKIEVIFWDYSYAPNKRQWIKGLPDLNSPTTIKRGDMYSVYIDKKYFDEILKYFRSMKEKQAVEINGKKMAVSYRLPFPNLK